MLADLHDAGRLPVVGKDHLADLRKLARREAHIHHGAGYLYDRSVHHFFVPPDCDLERCAFAPAEISVISCVMALWRSRLS